MSKKYLVFFCNNVFEYTSHLSLLFQLKFDFSIYNHTLVEYIFYRAITGEEMWDLLGWRDQWCQLPCHHLQLVQHST